jgi:hypothetical protein
MLDKQIIMAEKSLPMSLQYNEVNRLPDCDGTIVWVVHDFTGR